MSHRTRLQVALSVLSIFVLLAVAGFVADKASNIGFEKVGFVTPGTGISIVSDNGMTLFAGQTLFAEYKLNLRNGLTMTEMASVSAYDFKPAISLNKIKVKFVQVGAVTEVWVKTDVGFQLSNLQ